MYVQVRTYYNFVCINVMVTKYGYQNSREFQYDELSKFLFTYVPCKDRPDTMDSTESFIGTVQELFDECDDPSNQNLTMITTSYVYHQTELEDYVTNIALIYLNCKYLLLKKVV